MSYPRPTVVPLWATTLQNDGTTGEPNRAQPTDPKRDSGFTFNEKPTRQDLNWVLWNLAQWTDYFSQYINQSLNTTDNPEFYGLGLNSLSVIGNSSLAGTTSIVMAKITDLYGAPAGSVINLHHPMKLINGSSVQVGVVDPTTGTIDMFTLSINGTAYTGSAANLNTLVAGSTSNADSLHTHAGIFAYGGLALSTDDPASILGGTLIVLSMSSILPHLNTDLSTPNSLVISSSGIYDIEIGADLEYSVSEEFSASVAAYKGTDMLAYDGPSPNSIQLVFGKANLCGVLSRQHQSLRALLTLSEGDVLTLKGLYSGSGRATLTRCSLLVKKVG